MTERFEWRSRARRRAGYSIAAPCSGLSEAEILLEAGHTDRRGVPGRVWHRMHAQGPDPLGRPAGAGRLPSFDRFEGIEAHDYDWLRCQYRLHGGASFPRGDQSVLSLWRMSGRRIFGTRRRRSKRDEAEAFIDAAKAIIRWARREALRCRSASLGERRTSSSKQIRVGSRALRAGPPRGPDRPVSAECLSPCGFGSSIRDFAG